MICLIFFNFKGIFLDINFTIYKILIAKQTSNNNINKSSKQDKKILKTVPKTVRRNLILKTD